MTKIGIQQIRCYCEVTTYNSEKKIYSCLDKCGLRIIRCTILENLNKHSKLSTIAENISNKIS